jgi:hypothetical protein
MRAWVRFVVPFVLVAAACLPSRATGVGSALVDGQALIACPDYDPACSFSLPRTHLQQLTFTGGETANIVTFEYIPSQLAYQAVCLTEGPGACGAVFKDPDRFVFTDAWSSLYSTGLCRTVLAYVSHCATPNDNAGLYEIFPENAVSSLPVTVVLGGQNDEFVATNLPLNPQEFAFSVDGGWGSDKIVLNDNTGHDFGSYDQISCGDGIDTVITNVDVTVAPDCENVTRLT